MSNEKIIKDVLAAEKARSEALVADDHARVAQLFTDDLVYVHTTGLIHDKAQYLVYAKEVVAYLAIERGELNVRLNGNVAIMTGTQINTLKKRGEDQSVRGEGFVTQVWVCGADGWQIASFHGSRLPQ